MCHFDEVDCCYLLLSSSPARQRQLPLAGFGKIDGIQVRSLTGQWLVFWRLKILSRSNCGRLRSSLYDGSAEDDGCPSKKCQGVGTVEMEGIKKRCVGLRKLDS